MMRLWIKPSPTVWLLVIGNNELLVHWEFIPPTMTSAEFQTHMNELRHAYAVTGLTRIV